MLNEEVAKYRELSGDTNSNVPISRIGGYLDGYEKALEQKPCEEAISRQAALGCCRNEWEEEVEIRLKSLPPVTSQPKTGHWNCGDDMFEYAICSSCKHETGEAWEYAKRNFKYCPNCGAKMIEPQERSDKE